MTSVDVGADIVGKQQLKQSIVATPLWAAFEHISVPEPDAVLCGAPSPRD